MLEMIEHTPGLPLTTLELADVINQEMVENPLLEEIPEDEIPGPTPERDIPCDRSVGRLTLARGRSGWRAIAAATAMSIGRAGSASGLAIPGPRGAPRGAAADSTPNSLRAVSGKEM